VARVAVASVLVEVAAETVAAAEAGCRRSEGGVMNGLGGAASTSLALIHAWVINASRRRSSVFPFLRAFYTACAAPPSIPNRVEIDRVSWH
jgi:hypothetical protein